MFQVNAGKNYLGIFQHFQSYIQDSLRKFDISFAEFILLYTLYQKDGISQETLSKHTLLDKTVTSRFTKQLELKGLVTRFRDAGDRRIKLVYLTEKAHIYETEISKAVSDWHGQVMNGITSDEEKSMFALLNEMNQNARSLAKGEKSFYTQQT